jgi:hypothetical protein
MVVIPRKCCLPATTGQRHIGLTVTVTACTRPTHLQGQIQHWEGKWTQISPHPQPRSHLQLILAGKRKLSFLQWTVTGYINHTAKQAPCPGVGGQHKTNSMVFCLFVCLFACLLLGGGLRAVWTFCFILLGFGFFYLCLIDIFWLIILIFFFCCYLGFVSVLFYERESTLNWVDGEVERIWEVLGEGRKHNQNVLYDIFFN